MHYIRQTDEQIFFTTGLGDLSEQTLPRNLLQQHSQRPTKAGSNKSRQHSSPPVVRGMVSHAVPQGTWSTSARSPLPAQQSTDSQRPTTAAQQPASGTWHGVSHSPPGHVVHQRTQPTRGTAKHGQPAPNNSSTAARQWNVAWCLTQSPRARGPPAHAAPPAGTAGAASTQQQQQRSSPPVERGMVSHAVPQGTWSTSARSPPAGTAEQAQPAPNNSSSTAARQWYVAWCLTQSPRARGPPAHAAHQQAQEQAQPAPTAQPAPNNSSSTGAQWGIV